MTQSTTATDPADEVPTEKLRRMVARFADREQVAAAGYVFGAKSARVGDVAVVYSRAAYRAGIVIKVGRLSVTVVYTTETALREAADPRYGWTEPARTTKAGKFADVAIRPATAGAPVADAATGAAPLPAGSTGPVQQILGERQLDHNNKCVGCGAHRADPCYPGCPFETRLFRPAVLLRAACGTTRPAWATTSAAPCSTRRCTWWAPAPPLSPPMTPARP